MEGCLSKVIINTSNNLLIHFLPLERVKKKREKNERENKEHGVDYYPPLKQKTIIKGNQSNEEKD